MELEELDHALDAFKESLNIQKMSTPRVSASENKILSIAALQSNIGCIMPKRRDFYSAYSIFEEVLLVSFAPGLILTTVT